MNKFNKLFLIFVGLNILDAVLTYLVLNSYKGMELNPIMKFIFSYNTLLIFPIKSIGIIIFYYLVKLLLNKEIYKNIGLVICNSFYIFVVLNNAIVYLK